MALVGGYLFTNGFMALVGSLLTYLSLAKSESIILALILGCLVYLTVFTWVIATQRLTRTSLTVFGGAALMIGISLWLT